MWTLEEERHIRARARIQIVYMEDAYLPVRNGQRYFTNLSCLGAMELVNHCINMDGSSDFI